MSTHRPDLIGFGEALALTEVSATELEFWCRVGLIEPAHESTGRGDPRRFSPDNVFEIIMVRDLKTAGLSVPQLQQLFSALRTTIAATSPAWRSVALCRAFIAMTKRLALIFGRGPDYDRWLRDATAQLQRMVQHAKASGRDDEDDHDAALRALVAGMECLSRLPVGLRKSTN